MYEQFYGFSRRPFSILPDAGFLYPSRNHRYALSLLQYGLEEQTGFTVITGEIGAGKTTLVNHLLRTASSEKTIGHVTNTTELNSDLVPWLLYTFGVDFDNEQSVALYRKLIQFLNDRYEEDRNCVLIIDEAQHLTAETLEKLRLLSNVNSGDRHVLQILLVGQPELRQTLHREDLIQFTQRVSGSFHLDPLNIHETKEYIRYRLSVADGRRGLFTDGATDLIHFYSGGIPRQINILCDMALVYAYADNLASIDEGVMEAVLNDRTTTKHVASAHVFAKVDPVEIRERIAAEKEGRQAPEKDVKEVTLRRRKKAAPGKKAAAKSQPPGADTVAIGDTFENHIPEPPASALENFPVTAEKRPKPKAPASPRATSAPAKKRDTAKVARAIPADVDANAEVDDATLAARPASDGGAPFPRAAMHAASTESVRPARAFRPGDRARNIPPLPDRKPAPRTDHSPYILYDKEPPEEPKKDFMKRWHVTAGVTSVLVVIAIAFIMFST